MSVAAMKAHIVHELVENKPLSVCDTVCWFKLYMSNAMKTTDCHEKLFRPSWIPSCWFVLLRAVFITGQPMWSWHSLQYKFTFIAWKSTHSPCEKEVHFSIHLKRVLFTEIIYFKQMLLKYELNLMFQKTWKCIIDYIILNAFRFLSAFWPT